MTKLSNMNAISKLMSQSTDQLLNVDTKNIDNICTQRHSWINTPDGSEDNPMKQTLLKQLDISEGPVTRRRTSSSANLLSLSDEQKSRRRNSDQHFRNQTSPVDLLTQSYSKGRPASYEEELEEQVNRLRSCTVRLQQRLANERKSGKEMAQHMEQQEQNYKAIIEKMRLQYEQRFDRLKSRAGLLMQRCEQLRQEKKQAEEQVERLKMSMASERQNMEMQMAELRNEIEVNSNENKELKKCSAVQEQECLYVENNCENSDVLKHDLKATDDIWWNYYKILYDIAVTKVFHLESSQSTNKCSKLIEPSQEKNLEDVKLGEHLEISISRRSSSCPMLTALQNTNDLNSKETSLDTSNISEAGLCRSLEFASGRSSPNLNRCITAESSPVLRQQSNESSNQNVFESVNKISRMYINIVSPGGSTRTDDESRESSSSPKHIPEKPLNKTKRHASLPRMEFLKKFSSIERKDASKVKNFKPFGTRTTRSWYESAPCGQEFVDSGCSREGQQSSAESLPEEMPDVAAHDRLVRNGSAQSTFHRLQQRRNGVTDIVKIPPKSSKTASSSMLDRIGSNIKQYLHHQ